MRQTRRPTTVLRLDETSCHHEPFSTKLLVGFDYLTPPGPPCALLNPSSGGVGRLELGLFILYILLAVLSIFEPLLVLLAVGHGGAFEFADLFFRKLFISDQPP